MPGLLFILGRNPELSLAELDCALRPGENALASREAAVITSPVGADPVKLIQSLGGTTKIGRILAGFDSLGSVRTSVRSSGWLQRILEPNRHRIEFGVSVYGFPDAERLADELGWSAKRGLEELNRSVRRIEGRAGELSSVTVAKNGLMGKGFELLVANVGRRIWLGRTAAVQPFRQWGERDYGRPERDPKSGMLPPKLARMMVNLTGAPTTGLLIDPFCGSGTVLQEAWLRGFERVEGSDVKEKAVADSLKNLAWLKAKVPVHRRDAIELQKFYKPSTVQAIVTEPDLGPPIPIKTDRELHRRIDTLTMLYRRFLKSAASVLQPSSRIVMVWPAFRVQGQAHHLMTRDVVPPELHVVWPFSPFVPRTARQTLPYERPGQSVGREIVLLSPRSLQKKVTRHHR